MLVSTVFFFQNATFSKACLFAYMYTSDIIFLDFCIEASGPSESQDGAATEGAATEGIVTEGDETEGDETESQGSQPYDDDCQSQSSEASLDNSGRQNEFGK
jgi:hypothetical protein